MEYLCKCCGSELEPIIQEIATPSYDDGGSIDSMEVEHIITGYFPCEGCDIDDELMAIINKRIADEYLEHPEYIPDDLPF